MSEVWALLSAASFGVSDFMGGFATKEVSAVRITWRATMGGVIVAIGAGLAFAGSTTTADLAWGAASGIAGMIGLVFLFRAIAIGPIAVASPVTALMGAMVPFVVGLLTESRPPRNAIIGAALGMIAVPLLSGIDQAKDQRPRTETFVNAVVSGLGFGGFFALIAQVSSDSGMWPLLAAKLAALVALTVVVLSLRVEPRRIERRIAGLAYTSGAIDMAANIFFVLGTRLGNLAIIGVITSLYPAVTVGLGRIILKEHLSKGQFVGIAVMVAALSLIATASG